MDTSDILILFILFIIFLVVLYLAFVSKTEIVVNKKNEEKNKFSNYNNSIVDNYHIYDKDDKDDDEKSIVEIDNEGYRNEIMQTSENLKTGDYISQFKEIDFEKMPKSNSQIGFNPKPKDDKFELPYANINVEYLLST